MDRNQHIDQVFEENSKSAGTAYLLWFFFGIFSVHRFYAGRTKSAVVRLILLVIVVGWPLLALLWLADLFLIPGMIAEQNRKMLDLINAGAREPEPETFLEQEPEEAGRRLPPADSKRAKMLEELRATGYRKERRDDLGLYR